MKKLLLDNLYSTENKILICLLLFSLAIRLATLEFINPSDNAYYWYSAKILFYGQDYIKWMGTFSLSHQTTRFGLIIPVFLLQKVFGTSLYVIYILPVIVSVVSTGIIFRIGVIIKNVTVGFIAGILFTIFPPMIRNGSQLFPDILCSLYILLAFLMLLYYYESERKKIMYLIISAVLSFLAYLAKEPAIFLVFGVYGALYILGKNKKDLAVFAIVFSLLFFFESVFYYINFGDFMGRFHIVKSHHLHQSDFPVLNHFYELFYRYIQIPVYWKAVLYSYFIFLLYLFLIDKKANVIFKAFAFIGFMFFFCTTFALKSFKPLIVAQHFQSRYLDAGIAFVMPVVSYYFYTIYKNIISKYKKNSNNKSTFYNSKTAFYCLSLLLIAVIYISLFFIINDESKYNKNEIKIRHPFTILRDYSYNINILYRQGCPILFAPKDKRKATCLLLYVVLDQNSIPVDKMLDLPRYSSLRINNGEFFYFLKDNRVITTYKDLLKYDKYVFIKFVKKHLFYRVIDTSGKSKFILQ